MMQPSLSFAWRSQATVTRDHPVQYAAGAGAPSPETTFSFDFDSTDTGLRRSPGEHGQHQAVENVRFGHDAPVRAQCAHDLPQHERAPEDHIFTPGGDRRSCRPRRNLLTAEDVAPASDRLGGQYRMVHTFPVVFRAEAEFQ